LRAAIGYAIVLELWSGLRGQSVASLGVYLINLDRSPDRLATMQRRLDALGLTFVRVPAVDGAREPELVATVDRELYRRTHGRGLRVGEIGCYMSHLAVMRRFLADGPDLALVLEDDAVLAPTLPALIDHVCHEPLPRDWDMLKLESRRRGRPLELRQLDAGHRLCINLYRSTGSAGYLLTRHAAATYLQHLLPMRLPFDHAFDRGALMGLRVREVRPLPISGIDPTDTAGSTIAVTPVTDKARGLAKLPPLLDRTRAETARVVDGLRVWLTAPRRV
jgi:glycosyl transferase family 25